MARYKLSAGFGGSGRRWARGHTGQDFAVPVGTPVRSVGRGRVISLTCGDGFGISMVVQHGAGVFSQYAHLSAVAVGPGQRVRPGQQIALSGTTGNSTGPHLHFEVRRTPEMGSGVDPVPWLRKRGVRL
ncbi:M23 family metallopeptidase [Streptomyces sp. NPDC007100]|uniref:M23 family metallopeptidase n=1 Tax=Streptomyces sp. NPDC007100 TaxID=3155602 RepID=UPI003407DB71